MCIKISSWLEDSRLLHERLRWHDVQQRPSWHLELPRPPTPQQQLKLATVYESGVWQPKPCLTLLNAQAPAPA